MAKKETGQTRQSIQERANAIRDAISEALNNGTPFINKIDSRLAGEFSSLPENIRQMMDETHRSLMLVPSRRGGNQFWLIVSLAQQTEILRQDQGIASLLKGQYEKLLLAARNDEIYGQGWYLQQAHEVWTSLDGILGLDPRRIEEEIKNQGVKSPKDLDLPPSLFEIKYSNNPQALKKIDYMRNRLYQLWTTCVPDKDDDLIKLVMSSEQVGYFLLDLWDVIGAAAPGIQRELKGRNCQPIDPSHTLSA